MNYDLFWVIMERVVVLFFFLREVDGDIWEQLQLDCTPKVRTSLRVFIFIFIISFKRRLILPRKEEIDHSEIAFLENNFTVTRIKPGPYLRFLTRYTFSDIL